MTWAAPPEQRMETQSRSKRRGKMTKSDFALANRITGRANLPEAHALHPAWIAFIRHCRELNFGEISQLKIQDGIPVMAEETTKKVKFV
jgi:hypothetical protein